MADERPKPKYGELAPEGWTWTPPAPPSSSDVPVPSGGATPPAAVTPPPYVPPGGRPPQGSSQGTPPPPYQPPPEYSAPGDPSSARQPLNTVDVTISAFLLFFGVLLSASMLPALFDFSPILQQAAAAQGYGDFAPSAAANAAGTIAGIVTIILQLAAIVIAVRRLQRRKWAFPIVLVIGIVTFCVWVGAITYAFFNDPTFIQQVMSTAKAP